MGNVECVVEECGGLVGVCGAAAPGDNKVVEFAGLRWERERVEGGAEDEGWEERSRGWAVVGEEGGEETSVKGSGTSRSEEDAGGGAGGGGGGGGAEGLICPESGGGVGMEASEVLGV